EAKQCGLREPTAMCLSTAKPHGTPSSRTELLKSADERGVGFYPARGSGKAGGLGPTSKGALNFYGMPPGQPIRLGGKPDPGSNAEADAYFASRDRQSQIGAYASKQSQPIEGYFELERRAAEFALKFGVGKVPRPEFWSGYRVVPSAIEFWMEKPFRL